jgi:peroxiredoxin
MFMRLVIIPLLLLLLSNPTFAASATTLPPAKGGTLPVINLQVPKDPAEKMYLGLSGSGSFRIPQIRAQAVVIKIFSVYCPICQSMAEAMTNLYHQIENNPNFKNRIKLIGIGVGNSPLEVEVFKDTYKIPFPIFPDEDFRIHKALGEVRTPFFIAIKMERDGSHEIVHTYLGGLTNAKAFLDLMAEAYGIKQEELLIKEAAASPMESLPK